MERLSPFDYFISPEKESKLKRKIDEDRSIDVIGDVGTGYAISGLPSRVDTERNIRDLMAQPSALEESPVAPAEQAPTMEAAPAMPSAPPKPQNNAWAKDLLVAATPALASLIMTGRAAPGIQSGVTQYKSMMERRKEAEKLKAASDLAQKELDIKKTEAEGKSGEKKDKKLQDFQFKYNAEVKNLNTDKREFDMAKRLISANNPEANKIGFGILIRLAESGRLSDQDRQYYSMATGFLKRLEEQIDNMYVRGVQEESLKGVRSLIPTMEGHFKGARDDIYNQYSGQLATSRLFDEEEAKELLDPQYHRAMQPSKKESVDSYTDRLMKVKKMRKELEAKLKAKGFDL